MREVEVLRTFSPGLPVVSRRGIHRSLCKITEEPIVGCRNIPNVSTKRGAMLEWQEGVVHVVVGRVRGPHEDSYVMAFDGFVARPGLGIAKGMYAHVLVHLPSGTPVVSSTNIGELKELADELTRAFDQRGRPYAPTRELMSGMLRLFRFNQRRRKSLVPIRSVGGEGEEFEALMEALEADLGALIFGSSVSVDVSGA